MDKKETLFIDDFPIFSC